MKKTFFLLALSILANSSVYANSFDKSVNHCNEGDAKACYEAGKTYSLEAYKQKDYNSADAASLVAYYYKKSCTLGYAEGCTSYAMIFSADADSNPKLNANYYFKMACDKGDDRGCVMLKMIDFKR